LAAAGALRSGRRVKRARWVVHVRWRRTPEVIDAT